MARTARERFSRGMSIEDVADIPISKLQSYTPAQQRELVSRLASAANKRARNIVKHGVKTSALVEFEQSGGNISVRGKSGTELIKEFTRAREFLKNKYSKISEWNKAIKQASNKGRFAGMTTEQISDIYSAYNEIAQRDSNIVNSRERYNIERNIAALVMEGYDYDEVVKRTTDWLIEEREKYEREMNETGRNFSKGLDYDTPNRLKRKKRKKRNERI